MPHAPRGVRRSLALVVVSVWLSGMLLGDLVAHAQGLAPATVQPDGPTEPLTTPPPTPIDSSTESTTTPPPLVPPPLPSPTNNVTSDMQNILLRVGNINCTEDVRRKIYLLLYKSNVRLHDQCVKEGAYQLFPFTKSLPRTEQIASIVRSIPCTDLLSGVLLASFPECDFEYFSVRSLAEVLLRIKQDVAANHEPPTTDQFVELYSLNRVVNLLNENASLINEAFDSSPSRVSTSELARMMNRPEINPSIRLGKDLQILSVSSSGSGSSSQMGGGGSRGNNQKKETSLAPKPGDIGASSSAKQNAQAVLSITGILFGVMNLLHSV